MTNQFGIEMSERKIRKVFKLLDHLIKTKQFDKAQELCNAIEGDKSHMFFSPNNLSRYSLTTLQLALTIKELKNND